MKTMKIASWNVNSIKARLEHAQTYLSGANPDVLMVQELKGTDFPSAVFEDLGYQSVAVPQKAYNGVAILSKTPIKVILEALPDDAEDEQARYLECDINGLRVINIYLPNGNPVLDENKEFSQKFLYKLKWMERLYARLKHLRDNQIPFVIGGDFNVIPDDIDCKNPKNWAKDAVFRPETRAAYRRLLNLGVTDAFRVFNPAPEQYTFWGYRHDAWNKGNGIRIDHFLTSPSITDKLTNCAIDKAPRGWDTPSDHTPIFIEIEV